MAFLEFNTLHRPMFQKHAHTQQKPSTTKTIKPQTLCPLNSAPNRSNRLVLQVARAITVFMRASEGSYKVGGFTRKCRNSVLALGLKNTGRGTHTTACSTPTDDDDGDGELLLLLLLLLPLRFYYCYC